MNKIVKKFFIVFIFLILIIPNLIWPFLKPDFASANTENRVLAKFPTLSYENIENVPAGIENYIRHVAGGDHDSQLIGIRGAGHIQLHAGAAGHFLSNLILKAVHPVPGMVHENGEGNGIIRALCEGFGQRAEKQCQGEKNRQEPFHGNTSLV